MIPLGIMSMHVIFRAICVATNEKLEQFSRAENDKVFGVINVAMGLLVNRDKH